MLQNQKIKITDADIKRVEELFFKGKSTFEDEKGERYNYISCINESIDVEACPGSGKTTCLIAKLYLLANKLRSNNGQGICVLTHTNVAIDEIKQNLGSKADKFFQYPNYFGTIQSFVNKFLAYPYYSIRFKKRPSAIDPGLVAKRLQRTFLEYSEKEKVNSIKHFLAAKDLYDKVTIRRTEDDRYKLVNIYGNDIVIKKPNKAKNWPWSHGDLIDVLFRMRAKVLQESGLLLYDDAYFLANEYLLKYPQITKAISSRFSYVFIDEMQDTYNHQSEILRAIFDENTIVQRIGDPNQAIMNDNESQSAWDNTTERRKITGSHRFSQPIAKVLSKVALNGDEELQGFNKVAIPPHIISYKKGSEHLVLDKYVSIISKYKLDKDNSNKYPIKAVGWVGKEKDKTTIRNYFPEFNTTRKNVEKYENLSSYIMSSDYTRPSELYNAILQSSVEVISISINRNYLKYYNKTSFVDILKTQHLDVLEQLRIKVLGWNRDLALNKSKVIKEVRHFLVNTLFPTLEISLNKYALIFINDDNKKDLETEEKASDNTFISKKETLSHITVDVATVHSEKGRTHKATLYMETFYYKLCGEHLIEQLKGNRYVNNEGVIKERCLKVAHVGMSRPTQLLCVALNEELVNKNYKELKDFGWEIKSATHE